MRLAPNRTATMVHPKVNRACLRRFRRGGIYVAVLGVTLIVGIMAAVAISLVRIEMRTFAAVQEQQQARVLATAAAEYAVSYLQHASSWRSTLQSDLETSPIDWGSGQFTWQVSDVDGDLQDDLRDNLLLSGIGRSGEAVFVESVTLMPTGSPLTCLEVALLVNNTIVVPNGGMVWDTRIISNQTVASNSNIDATQANTEINADVQAGNIASGTINGTATNLTAVRDLPGGDVFDYYTTNGTWIPVTNLPEVAGKRQLARTVLSPATNPYGSTNPEGIYVVDCQGSAVEVLESRIVGTLVLLNPGSGSGVTSVALLEPAVPNYPALLVDGDCQLRLSILGSDTFSETTSLVNLNPLGTPYQGAQDSTALGSYNAHIDGLVYISGTASITGNTRIDGCLVCGAIQFNAGVSLTTDYSDIYLQNPPPGFAKGDPMRVIPGSWRRDPY